MMARLLVPPAAAVLSPGGHRARLSILIYHRVHPRPDRLLPGDPDAATFRWQMRLLARAFRPLPLAEAAARLKAGTLPARAVCVTFDDGYADNATVALPILQEVGVPATFFVATGYLDGGRMFNDSVIEVIRRMPSGRHDLGLPGVGCRTVSDDASRRRLIGEVIRDLKYRPADERNRLAGGLVDRFGSGLPDDLMMTTAQLRALAGAPGVEIGGHTVSHPILTRCAPDEAAREIQGGREALEALVGRPVRLFAYPNGRPGEDYGPAHVAMVRRAGFEAAVSTARGAGSRGSDPFQLPRFTPWDRTAVRFGLRLVRNLLETSHAQLAIGPGDEPGAA